MRNVFYFFLSIFSGATSQVDRSSFGTHRAHSPWNLSRNGQSEKGTRWVQEAFSWLFCPLVCLNSDWLVLKTTLQMWNLSRMLDVLWPCKILRRFGLQMSAPQEWPRCSADFHGWSKWWFAAGASYPVFRHKGCVQWLLHTTIIQLCGSLHGSFMTQAALFTASQPGCPPEQPPLPLCLLHWILDCKLMDQQPIQLTDRHVSLTSTRFLKALNVNIFRWDLLSKKPQTPPPPIAQYAACWAPESFWACDPEQPIFLLLLSIHLPNKRYLAHFLGVS